MTASWKLSISLSARVRSSSTRVLPCFGKEERAAVDHPLDHVGPPDGQVEEEETSCHEDPGDKDHDLGDGSKALPLVGEDNHGKCGKPRKCNPVKDPLHDHDGRSIPERDICLVELVDPYRFPPAWAGVIAAASRFAKTRFRLYQNPIGYRETRTSS